MNANDRHLTDDDLVLHYYGEMPEPDERRTATHLSACGVCHASYRRLQRVLAAVDEAAVVGPELPEHFERTVWARLEPELRRDRARWFSWFVQSPSRLAWVAGVIVLVTAAFFAGRWLPPQQEAPAQASATPTQVRERILFIDLGEHLERSQMVLLEIASADADTGLDAFERGRAEQLVAASRLYRQTATLTGNNTIAALLDEIERVLVDVAASPEHLPAEQLAEVRRRIDSQDLLFKVRVISSEVRERQRSAFQRTAGQSSSM
jgi:anti-sigma factor RsiW